MIRIAAIVSLVTLTACGVDGEPVRPTADAGVTINSRGVYPSASVGINTGPFWLRLGL
jgi:hypothetical protein